MKLFFAETRRLYTCHTNDKVRTAPPLLAQKAQSKVHTMSKAEHTVLNRKVPENRPFRVEREQF